MVDTISGLGSLELRFYDWGVDVCVAGSQKGLLLPPVLSFNAASEKAIEANKHARLQKSYWDWKEMRGSNENGFFSYTPATNLLYGLVEALYRLNEQGLECEYKRHARQSVRFRELRCPW